MRESHTSCLRTLLVFLSIISFPGESRAGSWAPIGLVIMGGLTTSTFLTLLIIPTIYSLLDDFTNFLKRVGAALKRLPAESSTDGSLEVAES